MDEQFKRCSRCDRVKPVDEFSRFHRGRSGRQAWCKACMTEHAHEKKYRHVPIADVFDDARRKTVEVDLVPLSLRIQIREWLVVYGFVRMIDDVFEAEGFSSVAHGREISGQRRDLVEKYYASADWTSTEWKRRFVRVCQSLVALARQREDGLEDLVKVIGVAGFKVDDAGRVIDSDLFASRAVPDLDDDSAIRMHFERIRESIASRPEEAIGASKDLVEATAKHVLLELGQEVPASPKLGELVRLAQRALGLHAEVIAPSREGADVIKKIVGALGTLALGIGELRNLYGTGHGHAQRSVGLHERHARLAAEAAHVYISFLLETLSDPRAPWRANQQAG